MLFKDVHNGNGICDVVDGADGVDDPHQHGDPVNSEPMNGDASNGHGEYDENSSGIFNFILISTLTASPGANFGSNLDFLF